jgi:splicing factor 3B subunit 3
MRTTIDTITGKLADTRPRFLGIKPVKCFKTKVLGKPGLVALSSRPWLIYNYMDKYSVALLAYFPLDYASPFCTGNC